MSANKLQNHMKPWTDEANDQLLDLFEIEDDPVIIARGMGRTLGATIGQLERLGKVINQGGHIYKKEFWFDNRKPQHESPGVREVNARTETVKDYLASPFKYLKDKHVSAFLEDLDNFRCEGAQYTLEQWQMPSPDLPGYTREAEPERLLELGIACNLGGWLGLSPSFRTAGGAINAYGQPLMNHQHSEYAIALWFGIPVEIAGALVGMSYPGYYDNVDVSTLDKAIEALERMRATGNPGV